MELHKNDSHDKGLQQGTSALLLLSCPTETSK